MQNVNPAQYKNLRLKTMRLWRDDLKAKGIEATEQELAAMWTKHDAYKVVEQATKQTLNDEDWAEVRKKRALAEVRIERELKLLAAKDLKI